MIKGDEARTLNFDLAPAPASWSNDDGSVELLYLPTWKSQVDTAGFFMLTVKGLGKDERGNPLRLAVKSLGGGSNRWFAIDRNKDAAKDLAEILNK